MIALPKIEKRRHFSAIVALYDVMARGYNDTIKTERDSGDLSRNPLRSSHRELFISLVNLASGIMEQNMYRFRGPKAMVYLVMEKRTPYSIRTNRKLLNLRTHKSESSIYRQIDRLMDAKIIVKKINHGPTRAFELFINPDILLISDDLNDKFDPIQNVLAHTENQAIILALRSICTEYYNNQNCYNNRIILERDKENSASLLFNEQTGTFDGNTENANGYCPVRESAVQATQSTINEFLSNVPTSRKPDRIIRGKKIEAPIINAFGVVVESAPQDAKPTINELYAKKLNAVRSDAEKRKIKFAHLMVEFMLVHLFHNKTIFQGEREKAYKVAEYYFERFCGDNPTCNAALLRYKERILLVQQYLERHQHKYSFANIYPAKYLDPDNHLSGFINTAKWIKDTDKWIRVKAHAKRLKTEDDIYQYAFLQFAKQNDLHAFMRGRQYLVQKAPSRVRDFEIAARSLVQSYSS